MVDRVITKQLGGVEDLLFGTDTAIQARQSGNKTITKINASHIPLIDAAGLIAAGDVEAGLAELIGLINTNITNIANNTSSLSALATADLVKNGSFEVADPITATHPADWTTTEETGGTVALDTTDANHGTQCVQITGTGTGGGNLLSNYIETAEGVDLYCSWFMKSSVADIKNTVSLEWYDKDKVYISSTTVYTDATTNPTAWTEKFGFGIAPATARFLRLKLVGCDVTDVTPGNVRFEGVRLTIQTGEPYKGADVASATALDVPGPGFGTYFDVTGAVAIASINAIGVGKLVKLHFNSTPTLTHHASNLILFGSANIVAEAGDEAEFLEYAAGQWRMVDYQRASGLSLLGLNGHILDLQPIVDLTNGGADDLSNYTLSGIPSWVKRVTIMINNASSTGGAIPLFQLGDSGGIETTGYLAGYGTTSTGGSNSAAQTTTGFDISGSMTASSDICHGVISFTLMDSVTNLWVAHGEFHSSTGIATSTHISGTKALTGVLTQIDFNLAAGTFDGGDMSIMYE